VKLDLVWKRAKEYTLSDKPQAMEAWLEKKASGAERA